MGQKQPEGGRARWLAGLLVAAVTVAAYANSFSGAFVLDDNKVIVKNAGIRRLWPPPESGLRRRFLCDFTFALNYAFAGLNAADYHAVNLAIHVGAALALYGLTRRTLRLPGVPGWLGSAAEEVAFLGAAAWAGHPLTTSAVTYVAQRYEVLMGLFYLSMLYALVRGTEGRGAWLWQAASVGACGLGMATKEAMITAPVAALLYDRIFLAGSFRRLVRERWGLYAGYALMWAGLAVLLAGGTPGTLDGAPPATAARETMRYALTQAGVVAHYLRLAVWPAGLCLDYAWPPVRHAAEALPWLLVVGGLAAACGIGLLRAPRAAFPGAFFFLVLGPTSSFVPRPDCAFEHRMYLPLAGLTVLASVALASLLRGSGRCNGERSDVRRGAYRSVAAALVVALATATHARNAVFESAEIVWRDVLRSRPGNLRAQAALNCEMLRQARWAEAEEGARRLLDESRSSLSSGEIPFTQAAADPRRYYVAAHSQLGLVMLARGRPDAALPHFTEAIRSDRSGAALQYYWRATAYRAKGDVRSAVQDLLEAVRLEPGMERAQEALGEALAAQGLYAEAIQRFDRALAANPDQASSALELAWLLATAPDNALRDGERAVRLARAVDAKTGGSSMRALEVLAAGLAETGRYGEATGTARQALGLARSRKGAPAGPDDGAESYLLPAPAPDRLRQIEAAMRLYESGRPLRLSAGGAAAGEGNG